MNEYRMLKITDCVPICLLRPVADKGVQPVMQSFADFGQLQPVLACPHPEIKGKHGLIAGNHRLEAARRLNWTEIEARYFPPGMSIDQMLVLAMAENNARTSMNFMDRADAVQLLAKETGLSLSAAGKMCGMSASEVSQVTSCMEHLEETVRLKLANANIGHGTAYELAKVEHARQLELVDDVVNGTLTREQLKKLVRSTPEKSLSLKIPNPTDYDGLIQGLKLLIEKAKTLQKNGLPLDMAAKLLR